MPTVGVTAGRVLAATPATADDGSAVYVLQTSGSGGGAVTIADGADAAEGAKADTAYTDITGAAAGSAIALFKGLYVLQAAGKVQGNVASAATDSGNPVKIGGVYNSGALSAVTTGQRSNLQTDQYGNVRVALTGISASTGDTIGNAAGAFVTTSSSGAGGGAILVVGNYLNDGTNWNRQRGDLNAASVQPALSASFWSYPAATGGISNTTTAVTVKAAAGAGVRNYIEAIDLSWDALANATEFAIRDGAAGTVLWRCKLPSAVAGNRYVKLGTALKGTANTLVEVVTLTASGAGAVFANLQGWTGV